jgi:hypothetical protein
MPAKPMEQNDNRIWQNMHSVQPWAKIRLGPAYCCGAVPRASVVVGLTRRVASKGAVLSRVSTLFPRFRIAESNHLHAAVLRLT